MFNNAILLAQKHTGFYLIFQFDIDIYSNHNLEIVLLLIFHSLECITPEKVTALVDVSFVIQILSRQLPHVKRIYL